MVNQAYRTSSLERVSYGSYFFGQNVIYTLQFQFLSFFYTESVGLSIASASLLLLIARLLDAFYDPLMGAIVDKHLFKSSKYLVWLRIVTYTVPLSLVFVFFSIGQTYSVKLIFAYATYLVWGMLYTMSDSPLFSLSTAMTDNIFERDKLISYGRLAAALAAISSAVFMSLKGGVGWTGSISIYALISFLAMFPLQFLAKERIQYKRSSNITFKKIFTFLFKNKKLMIYYVGFLAISSTNTLQTMAVYFANSNLGDAGKVTIIMGISVLPVVILAPMLPMIIKKFGKRNITIFCCIMTVFMCLLQYFAGYDNFALFLALAAIRVAFMQLPLLIYGMFTADCIEYGAFINGERTEAIAFSVQTLMTKLSGALCVTLSLQMMGFFGYVTQGKTQTPEALHGIWIIMSLVPIVGYLIMLIVMTFFYKLSETQVSEMMATNQLVEMASRDESNKE
ncbi:MAG TPA: glycoside-pentoside-hexuronide (GPH):cation symporter [Clostridiaceae bacterium]